MSYIRLTRIELKNIKNVQYGELDFSLEKDVEKNGLSNVFGIYGPNGSGKTSLVTAISLIKNLVCGIPLNSFQAAQYINVNNDTASLACDFTHFDGENDYSFCYEVELKKQISRNTNPGQSKPLLTVLVLSESLTFLGGKNDKSTKKFLSVNLGRVLPAISPVKYYENFFSDQKAIEQFYKSRITSESFIFSKYMTNKLESHNDFSKFAKSIIEFKKFATVNLFVIDQSHNNDVFLNLNYRSINDKYIAQMNSSFINYRFSMPDNDFPSYERSIKAANVLLESLIPGVEIKIDPSTLVDTSLMNNEKGKSFELVSVRDGKTLPMSLESNGIKSIFAIASLLVTAYNDSSIMIAIDEFDSGVFEYLLGGILEIYKESGKGLFVFTSHNLRPLEILGKNNIYFTVEGEGNKFAKYPYIQPGTNFRNQYIRSLFLGSNEDVFAFNVKKGDIRKAFLKAVKVYNE